MPPTSQIGVGMSVLPQEAEAAALSAKCRESIDGAWINFTMGCEWCQCSLTCPDVQTQHNSRLDVGGFPTTGDEQQLYIAARRQLTLDHHNPMPLTHLIPEAIPSEEGLKISYSGLRWADSTICSFSNRAIVYRHGAFGGLGYTDLNPATSRAIYHRRWHQRTLPQWPLAQPMRLWDLAAVLPAG